MNEIIDSLVSIASDGFILMLIVKQPIDFESIFYYLNAKILGYCDADIYMPPTWR